MHLYEGTDKAIEFNATYRDLMLIISNLKDVKIDVSEQESRIKALKSECEQKAIKKTQRVDLELLYDEYRNKLLDIKKELEVHNAYCQIYYHAVSIKRQVDKKDVGEEQIKAYSKGVIGLLKQINESDTRAYSKEVSIVNFVYDLAYSVLKLELAISGQSDVFDFVKNDDVSASYMNSLVAKDIASLNKKFGINEAIQDSILEIKKQGSWCSYLDKKLLLYIALQSNNFSKESMENKLDKLYAAIKDNHEKMMQSAPGSIGNEQKLRELKKRKQLQRKAIKYFAIWLGGVLFLTHVKSMAFKAITENVGQKVYRTNSDFYSNSDLVSAPVYPDYMEAIDGFEKTTLKVYDRWYWNIHTGEHSRKIRTYDLNNVELENLSDIMEMDLLRMPYVESIEKKDDLKVGELYNEAIMEVSRLIQDTDDSMVIPDESQSIYLLLLTIGYFASTIALGRFIGGGGLGEAIYELKNLRKSSKEELKRQKEELEFYKELCEKDKEFKDTFVQCFNQYGAYLSQGKKGTYDTLAREIQSGGELTSLNKNYARLKGYSKIRRK